MANRTDNSNRCSNGKKLNDGMKLIIATFIGVVIGFFLGISFPTLSLTKINFPSTILPSVDIAYVEDETPETSSETLLHTWSSRTPSHGANASHWKIWVPSNPRGAEMLTPGIIAPESDYYLRRLWGLPEEDIPVKPKYLIAFTVGLSQRVNVDACVKKFSEDLFTLVLFHYDGRTTEWEQYEWSKRAIHVSVPKQTKWWYAKRFLHPDIVAPYDYIFIWDEDLGLEHFDAEEYIRLIKKHGLEISQPGVESKKKITWEITKRKTKGEVHKDAKEKPGRCNDPHLPPCAAFIEIMAPVFSRDAWRCVWHMLQNDLVHGWGLDFALRKCVEPAHEKIGVVDSQWIIHQTVPSLGSQGEEHDGVAAWQGYLVNRMLVYVDREFKHRRRIPADELSFLFSSLSDAVVKKTMRIHGIFLERDKNGHIFWYKKHRFDKIPHEIELKNLVAPEDVCSYESMLAGLYRLKHLGITQFTLPASISTALAHLPDEAIALAAASHIERELQITPWNLSSNFVACTTQDRANIERLEITGVGDPSGRGLGFSYVRAAPKVPAAAGSMKKKEAACCGAPTVTGTDADLRRLSREAAREVLLKFNVPDEKMAKQNRWHLIAMIRKLSSEQAASGVLKVDPTTIGKYARGQRMSFLQLQQQAREKCQEIWDRQLLSLSACDDDESESENDMDSFVGDLENLLDAEEWEESNTSKNDKLDGVNGFKMRRRPYQVVTDEDVEDEAAECAELRRLLMKDDEKRNMNAEFVRKDSVSAKKHIATRPDASFLVTKSTFKNTRNVSVFKERKPVRDNFFCGACGQPGHMKTNKHCPKYRATTEPQPEGIYVKKSSGTPSSSDLSGQVKLEPIKSKKTAPKSPTKVSVDEAPKGDNPTSKTGGLTLRFKCAIPAGGRLDKPGSETPRRSMEEPDRPLPSLMPAFIRERGESESHRPSVSGQSFSNTERNQAASSRLTMSITQPSLRMDKELVIQRPNEREQPQKKLVIKRSKVITDSLELTSQFESRKTMRMAEPEGFQSQQRFRLSENSLHRGPKEGRVWQEEREISTERHREARVRRDYDDMTKFEKASEIGSEREEKERQKKLQPEVIERYLEGYPRRRNDRKLLERVQKVRSQYDSDFERNVAEYAPQPKRRKKGEVGLANILEVIVDTLRAKEVNVSYLFLKPVSKKEAPDYHDVVQRPMDLSIIRDKVRRVEYRDRAQFRNDVWQIKYNAHIYNDGRNPMIPPLADELLVKCDGLLDRYRDELTEAEKGIVNLID